MNTLYVTFTIPRYRLSCRYRPVQKLCYRFIHSFWTSLYIYSYISINRNFKTLSMILIKMFICLALYVRFYLFLNLQFLLRFLNSLKNLYFVCLQFNTIVTDIEHEGNIRIYRLPSEHDQAQAISFSLVFTTTLGQSVYPDIALYISNYYIIIMPCYFYLSPDKLARKIYLSVYKSDESGMASMPTGFFIWGYMYPFTIIFGGAMYPLTLHLGEQRKLTAFSPRKVVYHAVFCKYYAELAKFFFSVWH